MSGIVGIINLDGSPVDRDLLKRMTDFMTFRGPDAQEIWIDGNVGFGHTMLRTTWEAETETQPLTLDGKVWLTADARIDGRKELIAELESKLRTKLQIPHRPNGNGSESRIPNDAELILFAYQAWGEDCVKHLIGDFAFAIWDGRERRLFCGRDHLGVKPFYYARVGNSFLFSNTLNCLRLHHAVSNKLNDLAVADFLLFGFNQDQATTTFADIQRVPPAHWIGGSGEAVRVRRYWTLPINEQSWQMSETESIDQFRSLLSDAVEDRLRTDRVAVSLSGGLDSSTVAATARELWAKKNRSLDLKGFTMVYDQLLPDEERHYSGLVAESLGIPIQYLVVDNYRLFDRINQLHRPEPSDFPLPALVFDYLNQVTGHSRVLLSGDGGDPLMFYSWKDLARLLKRFRVLPVLRYIAWHLWAYRQLPRLGYRETWKYWTGRQSDWRYSYPSWLSQSLTERLDLQARLEVVNELPVSIHSERPEAYNNFLRSSWVNGFESGDPGATSVPVETRYPFFDLRLVDFFLRLPAIPWCVHKEMIRKAMRGVLPETIRTRPKTPLAGNQLREHLRDPNLEFTSSLKPAARLEDYVSADAIDKEWGELDSDQQELNLRAICVNYWLQNAESVKMRSREEE